VAKFVALFGALTQKQLRTLSKAGYTGLSTDAAGEASTLEAAKAVGMTVIVRPAAWNVMDHILSVPTTGVGRDGNPREYNRNGGYTRDAMVVAECHAVVLGSGLPPSRVDLIQAAAKEAGRPVRELVETAPEVPYSYEAAKAELDSLAF
jgi:hypothetical protein